MGEKLLKAFMAARDGIDWEAVSAYMANERWTWSHALRAHGRIPQPDMLKEQAQALFSAAAEGPPDCWIDSGGVGVMVGKDKTSVSVRFGKSRALKEVPPDPAKTWSCTAQVSG